MVTSSGELEEFLGQVMGWYEQPRQHPGRHTLPPTQVMQGSSLLLKRGEKLLAQNQVIRVDNFRQTLLVFRKQTAALDKALLIQSLSVQGVVAQHLTDFAQSVLE